MDTGNPLYTWSVTLENGAVLTEAELGGMARLDLPRVRRLDVWCPGVDPDRPAFTVPLWPDQTLIFFRRQKIRLRIADAPDADGTLPDHGRYCYATVVGWKRVANGVAVCSYCWLLHDGRIVLSDRDIERSPHPWLEV